ncbi:MAG TPA: glycosyltransferase 87 family protein [Allosphingosinicella sp.]|nr:glycosyltransferase 87 family protein [Allosphingosinicella sp.]
MADRVALLIFAAFMAATALLAVRAPIHNWDMIAYVALAETRPGIDAPALQERAYAIVRAEVPPRDWELLSRGNAYRTAQHRDPAAFDSQLGMYRIKVAYVGAGRALGAFLSPIAAYRAINLIALALLAAAAIGWMAAGGFAQAAIFVAPAFALAGLPHTARMVTPDVLCAASAVAGLALMRRGRWPLGALCFGLATAVRPDFLSFPAALLAVALAMRVSVREAAAAFAAGAAAYAVAMLAGDHPGWWTHFSFSLLERAPDLDAVAPFSPAAYFWGAARAWASSLATQSWPALTVLFAAAWLLMRGRPGQRERQADILFLAVLGSVLIRCVAFPLPEQRLYLPALVMLAMLVAERWAPRFAPGDSKGTVT